MDIGKYNKFPKKKFIPQECNIFVENTKAYKINVVFFGKNNLKKKKRKFIITNSYRLSNLWFNKIQNKN